MTRIIKASEVKPGMTIRWRTTMQVDNQLTSDSIGGVMVYDEVGNPGYISSDTPVMVLSEPDPAQPEEPTEFGARVVVGKSRFIRGDQFGDDMFPWLGDGDGERCTWAELLKMGPVTVVPDQGWTVPDDTPETPEVPERIEEWPEADEHLRKHKWRDMDGDTWTWAKAEDKWECRSRADIRMGASRRPGSWFGPFTRVTDA